MNLCIICKFNCSVKKQLLKKILENGKKYWKSQGILSVRNTVGTLL